MQGISRIALLAALAATGFGGAAVAQEADDDTLLGTITLTASLLPKALSETGSSVTVITQEDLLKAGDQSVANQLSRLPGVSMTRNGGLGSSTALRLRGLSAQYIGVRIDGIDVSDPSGVYCQYDFGTTTIAGISRIEVLRGSQSALYGSEAIGGVIEITGWRPTKDGVSADIGVEAGSEASYSGSASVGFKSDRTELAFTLSRSVTDGISAYAFGPEDDGFRNTSASLYVSHALSDSVTVGANLMWRKSYVEFDDQTADRDNTEDGILRGGRVFAEFDLGAIRHELSFARTLSERDYAYPAPSAWYSATSFDGTRSQLAYKGSWEGDGGLSLVWGLDQTKETFDSVSISGLGPEYQSGAVTTKSAFAEAIWTPSEGIDVSLALRHDDHETFGGFSTGRLALAWNLREDLILRAVASNGFRAPALDELYNTSYGNPSLKPETSTSYELGLEYTLGNGGSIQATLFDTEIDDKIAWSGSSYNQVPGTTRTRGLELIGSTPVADGWEIFGSYTYTDAFTVSAAGVQTAAIRVPRHDLSLGVSAQITDQLSGLLTVQHVADFWDAGLWPAPPSKMPDYTVANVAVTYDISDAAQAYIRVENIFDEEYQTVRNYGQPGRQVFVGVRTSF